MCFGGRLGCFGSGSVSVLVCSICVCHWQPGSNLGQIIAQNQLKIKSPQVFSSCGDLIWLLAELQGVEALIGGAGVEELAVGADGLKLAVFEDHYHVGVQYR